MSESDFIRECAGFRDSGYLFLGLQTNCDQVSYLFEGGGQIVSVSQTIEENTVKSIAQLFPLADFAERQMYRDCKIKALGNINLVPRED